MGHIVHREWRSLGIAEIMCQLINGSSRVTRSFCQCLSQTSWKALRQEPAAHFVPVAPAVLAVLAVLSELVAPFLLRLSARVAY